MQPATCLFGWQTRGDWVCRQIDELWKNSKAQRFFAGRGKPVLVRLVPDVMLCRFCRRQMVRSFRFMIFRCRVDCWWFEAFLMLRGAQSMCVDGQRGFLVGFKSTCNRHAVHDRCFVTFHPVSLLRFYDLPF